MVKTIFRLIKLLFAIVLLYLAVFSFNRYQATQQPGDGLGYRQYNLNLHPEFHQQQFKDYNSEQKMVEFSVNKEKQVLMVSGREIPYSSLQIQDEDASHIQSVSQVKGKEGCLKISSRFFTLIYCIEKQSVCYQKFGANNGKEYYFADSNQDIWIFTHPNHNILILRLFQCKNGGILKKSQRLVQQNKIQSINAIQFGKNDNIFVSTLTFSRNTIIYQFDHNNYRLQSTTEKITHQIQQLQKQEIGYSTKISQQIKINKFYSTLLDMLYEVSGGEFGAADYSYLNRQVEKDYDIEVLDFKNNIILEFNHTEMENRIISLSDVLLPFRTPVFISKDNYAKMRPAEDALNNSKNADPANLIDFKIYEIKTKSIKEMKDQVGLYRMIPDASVHFLSFDDSFMSLYPQENINRQQYYTIRTENGGLVLKGTKIQGMFSDTPISPNQQSIKYGIGENQVYQQLTTTAKELAPGIYEAHIIHKGLFTYHKKNRIQLITPMNGKSVLTYYLHHSQGYTYTTSFLENNEFWVFEHHNSSAPIITKHELYLNASTPKSILSIKRNYELPITGKVTKVQKCIDGFYYFDYISAEGKYGIARAHHAIMSNRQPHPQGKEAGAFQKYMIIQNIERNPKLRITADQQQILAVQLPIAEAKPDSWNQLQLKHQYSVLPYRVYSQGTTYYLFNIRKYLIQGFDSQLKKTQRQTYLTNAIVLGLFSILAFGITILGKSEAPKGEDVQTDKKKGEDVQTDKNKDEKGVKSKKGQKKGLKQN